MTYMSGKDNVVLQGGDTNVKPVRDFLLKEDVEDLISAEDGGELVLPALRAKKFDVTFADFDKSSTTATFETGVTIPKGAFVVKTLVDNVVKFEGGGVTAATMKIGETGDDDRYMTGTLNVFQDKDVGDAGDVGGTALHTAAKEVEVELTTTTADCDALTAGSAVITIFYYLAADHS